MDEYRFYTSLYSSLLEKPWMPPNSNTLFRRIVRNLASKRLPVFFESHPIDKSNNRTKEGVIASFTSFPARIEYAYLVVQCMLHQTIIPEKIILWLSREQFNDKSELPPKLVALENGVFEIRLVIGDIRSHKKYYYVCKEYPSSLVVLLDDDIFYHPQLVERLLSEYTKGEKELICNYGYRIIRDSKGHLLPYNQWKALYTEAEGEDVFFGSGGGTLFKPSDFDPILTNIELARLLTPIADDIWLNTIARLSNVKIKMMSHGSFLPIVINNNKCLYSSNMTEGQNDSQLEAVCSYFKIKDYRFVK